MKNSTIIKGSAAIALGAALLLGGGGTLANWNASATATPGTIVAGDLNVENNVAGKWTDRAGNPVTISTYTVVPGDKLTYSQDLVVTLKGDKMAAQIATTGINKGGVGFADSVIVSEPVLTMGDASVPNRLTPTGDAQTVTATITFEFKAATTGRTDVGATYDFNDVGFTLTQVNSTGDGLS